MSVYFSDFISLLLACDENSDSHTTTIVYSYDNIGKFSASMIARGATKQEEYTALGMMTKDVTYPLGLVSIYFYHHMDQVKHKQRQIVIKFTCVNLLLSCRIYISSATKVNLP